MLGKINATNEVLAIDEQIAVEYEDVEHIVDIKLTRNEVIRFANLCSTYAKEVESIMVGDSDKSIEEVDKDFSSKSDKFIDLSFIKGKGSENKKINTVIQINRQLEKIKP